MVLPHRAAVRRGPLSGSDERLVNREVTARSSRDRPSLDQLPL